MLVSGGVQCSSELPLCSGVLRNSPVLSVTTMGLGQTGSTFPRGWLLNPDLSSREEATAQRRPCTLGLPPHPPTAEPSSPAYKQELATEVYWTLSVSAFRSEVKPRVEDILPDSITSCQSSSCLSQALRKGNVGATLSRSQSQGPKWSEAQPAKGLWPLMSPGPLLW